MVGARVVPQGSGHPRRGAGGQETGASGADLAKGALLVLGQGRQGGFRGGGGLRGRGLAGRRGARP